uniref:Uncharacterized protein AlNc14C166G7895 n=1 Tax=Albugo laibachii Nc14 TaxID=890382 RepID=F0WN62_9STRA|nr:conserved unknown protein putative [Albugo laibachii Nc14]|eukprot:CCA22751.1 conserved unknown protein putative [Albugo laibachii Nc14]
MRQTRIGGNSFFESKLISRAIRKCTTDHILENEARVWIEAITEMHIGQNFGLGLRDGIILCTLINRIFPNMIRRIEADSKLGFKLVENILNFLNACRSIGVSDAELFETIDLFELKNIGNVVRCIHALGRAVQKNNPSFIGPRLGRKEAIRYAKEPPANKFMKTNWVPSKANVGDMSRLSLTHSNHITFAADAVRKFHRPPPPPPPLSAERLRLIFGDLLQTFDKGPNAKYQKLRWREDPLSTDMAAPNPAESSDVDS